MHLQVLGFSASPTHGNTFVSVDEQSFQYSLTLWQLISAVFPCQSGIKSFMPMQKLQGFRSRILNLLVLVLFYHKIRYICDMLLCLIQAKTFNRLKTLKVVLRADLIYIKDTNAEIQEKVPTPEEQIVFIDLCEEDIQVQQGISNFIEGSKRYVEAYLKRELPCE